ncbi:MAG TPA: glycosyltransferase family 9 protein [bacterium]|nr:glycosyltransferase family 9 protein [bacterium]
MCNSILGMKQRRFLVIKLGSIGDVVHALPAVHQLRTHYPDAVIDWLIERKSALVLDGNVDISSRIVIDTKRWRRDLFLRPLKVLFEIRRLVDHLRSARYDAAIDLQGLLKSSVLAWLSKSRLRFGFPSRECRERLSARFINRKCWHAVDVQHVVEKLCSIIWCVAEELGDVEPVPKADFCRGARGGIVVSDGARRAIRDFLGEKGVRTDDLLIGLNPCAGWETKRWGGLNFARVIRALMDTDLGRRMRFVLLYGPGEKQYAEEILQALGQDADDDVFFAPPVGISRLCALLEACDVVVSGDTAVLHIAANLGRPTVALFGPSDPARNGPFGNPSAVFQHAMACGPCYKRRCKSMACIKNISPVKVAAAVERLLT